MADAVHLNGAPHPAHKDEIAHAKLAASTVWVSQSAMGAPVTNVTQSSPGSNNLYWLCFSNTATVHSAVFTVTFKAGSPLQDQTQAFTFPIGYAGSITTPFGVPYWGGNPITGPAVLKVATNVGGAGGTYNFSVVL
jgi:hypothetical protein